MVRPVPPRQRGCWLLIAGICLVNAGCGRIFQEGPRPGRLSDFGKNVPTDINGAWCDEKSCIEFEANGKGRTPGYTFTWVREDRKITLTVIKPDGGGTGERRIFLAPSAAGELAYSEYEPAPWTDTGYYAISDGLIRHDYLMKRATSAELDARKQAKPSSAAAK